MENNKYKNCIIFLILYLSLQLKLTNSARILGIFPVPFREHQIIYRPLIDALASKGHELVILTTDPYDSNNSNITQIDLSFTYNLKVLDNLKETSLSGSEMLRNVFNAIRKITEMELKSDKIQNLLNNKNNNEHFDAVIVEFCGASMMNAFAHKYNAKLIGITSGGALINSHESFGNPIHPIAYPNILLPFSEDLNLLQRIGSVIFTFWYRYLYFTEELPLQNKLAQEYFGMDLPDLWNIESNADLLLINSYQELGNIRPTVPSTIYLGGIHAKKLNKLPQDLKIFLQNTDNDVIYINIGKITEILNFQQQRRLNTIINAANELKLDVILNCDRQLSINTTVRIYYSPDIYQEDILAHPKVKLFITNGGQKNIEDAIHHKIPILGISHTTYFEQYLRQIEKYNTGIVSLIDFETSDKFIKQVEDVIYNTIYQKNINNLNRLLLDRPMSTIDTAIWWIEYTIRNNGNSHMKNNNMKNMSWIQYLLIDVLLTISMFIIILVCVFVYLICRLIKYSKSLPFEMVTNKVIKVRKSKLL